MMADNIPDHSLVNDQGADVSTPARVEKEAMALRQLRSHYCDYNCSLFGGVMRQPILAFTEAKQRLGGWRSSTRTLDISRELVWRVGWGQVLEVLKHEMAHQYVDEVLAVADSSIAAQSAHGAAFREVCKARGIDARATSEIEDLSRPLRNTTDDEARLAKRVSSLLSLAQSQNEHEARNAARLAQRMMLKHNIKVATDSNLRVTGSIDDERYTYCYLGEACGRIYEWQRTLAGMLEQHYFVSVIWIPVWVVAEAKKATVLEACGTPSNIEMASYVHAFLVRSAASLWQTHTGGKRKSGRLRYFSGIMSGFREQLEDEEIEQQDEGLIWQGDPEVDRYLRRRHPNVRSTRRSAARRDETFSAGQQAGRSIVLNRGISSNASTSILGLLGS